MKKTFLLAALLCSFFPEIGASGIPVTDESTIVQQNRKVEGIIVDEAGEPVIGVNVRVKGNSTLGTITDYDGKFSIDVSSKDILVFSYIGYKTQEVKVGDQKSLRIKMKERDFGRGCGYGFRNRTKERIYRGFYSNGSS